MNLFQLRQLLKEYQETWYLRKYIWGDHEEAILIKEFLSEYENVDENYEFNASEVFTLLQILSPNSGLPLVTSIINHFSYQYLWDIYHCLNEAELINKNNFLILYKLSEHERLFLYNLFCGLPVNRITLNAEILQTVFSIARGPYFFQEDMENCLRFLDSKNSLNSIPLNFLKENADKSKHFLVILTILDNANCLSEKSIGYIVKHKTTFLGMTTLISLLSREKIVLTEELIRAISISDCIYSLIDISSILIAAKKCYFDSEILGMLLKKNHRFFIDKIGDLTFLQKHDLLNRKLFYHICQTDFHYCRRILEILAEKSLFLPKNKKLVIIFMNNKDLCFFRLYTTFCYLSKAGLLNQKSIDACLNLFLITHKHNVLEFHLFDLFKHFDEIKFHLSEEFIEPLFLLSDRNIQRLNQAIGNLHENKLLDQFSFKQAYDRITLSLPAVEKSTIVKYSRKITHALRSEIRLDNKQRFFTDHSQQYESGGFGKVKKTYRSADSNDPLYGMKKLKKTDLSKVELEAIREVKYHRLLGREAYYFFNKGKISLIFDWQREKAFDHFSENELLQTPFVARLRCLSSALSDLNVLHLHYRVHGDIKCENFILDLKTLSMNLIDFGTAHKKNSSKQFAYTERYTDPCNDSNEFSKDIYAMGIVTMFLFPELYSVTFSKEKPIITIRPTNTANNTNLNIAEQAILNLVDAMMYPNYHIRCTSQDALDYCINLIKHFNSLDEVIMEKIASASISRSEINIEDVFRAKGNAI